MLKKQADPSDGLSEGETLTFTLLLSSPSLTAQLWDRLPAALEYVPNSITGTLFPLAEYSPAARAVIWQGTLLPTATGNVIRFQVTPGITHPVVNKAWLTDTATGIGVHATVIVNGRQVVFPVVMRDR